MPPPRVNITEEQIEALGRAADELRARNPQLTELAAGSTPDELARRVRRAVATGVLAGGAALVILLLLIALIAAFVVAIYGKVHHLLG